MRYTKGNGVPHGSGGEEEQFVCIGGILNNTVTKKEQ